jgi:hypothetical protein
LLIVLRFLGLGGKVEKKEKCTVVEHTI